MGVLLSPETTPYSGGLNEVHEGLESLRDEVTNIPEVRVREKARKYFNSILFLLEKLDFLMDARSDISRFPLKLGDLLKKKRKRRIETKKKKAKRRIKKRKSRRGK